MIEIYGKTQCPYCDKAKQLCEREGYEFIYKQLDKDFTREELFEQFPGARTFPQIKVCLLYTSPSPRDLSTSRMPSSA